MSLWVLMPVPGEAMPLDMIMLTMLALCDKNSKFYRRTVNGLIMDNATAVTMGTETMIGYEFSPVNEMGGVPGTLYFGP